MVTFYKTEGECLLKIDAPEKGSWINMVSPTEEEIAQIAETCSVESDFLKAALDEEETSRIDMEEKETLIIVDVPATMTAEGGIIYSTLPMGIILTGDYLITVCLRETSVIKEFADGKVKNARPEFKSQFMFMMLLKIAQRFLQYLRQIDRLSVAVEKKLHKSQKNKELIQLLDLEKSLVYFSTSLKANELTIEKILRGRIIKIHEDDQDLLDDVLIEIRQAIEMSNIYTSILSGTMDAFASVISNNLNIVMKVLASITIIMAIPNIISGYFGMNVIGIPLETFWAPVFCSLALMGVAAFWLYKKDML